MKKFELDDGVEIYLTDRADGNMRVVAETEEVRENIENVLARAEMDRDDVSLVRVTYDRDDYCEFYEVDEGNLLRLGAGARVCDGLVTRDTGVGLFLPLADCLGLVMYDEATGTMMMVHCGRHTVLQKGASRAVEFMETRYGVEAENVKVWLSPSAGAENYPVHGLGGDSLQEAAVKQLLEAGVVEENIERSTIDTTTDENYYSYCMGDEEERFAIMARRIK